MDVRSQNKEKRRQRILFEARRVISQDGYDALTTRALAKAAGVTQPTLYNLIGTKDDILKVLLEESVARVWDRLRLAKPADPLAAIEAVVLEPLALFEADSTYYRAAVIASDRMMGPLIAGPKPVGPNYFVGRESVQMAIEAVQGAVDAGLIGARYPAALFGEQMYICFRGPMRDWAYGFISLDEFRTRALRGFYLTLAIDAAPDFKTVLEAKIADLVTADTPSGSALVETKTRRRP